VKRAAFLITLAVVLSFLFVNDSLSISGNSGLLSHKVSMARSIVMAKNVTDSTREESTERRGEGTAKKGSPFSSQQSRQGVKRPSETIQQKESQRESIAEVELIPTSGTVSLFFDDADIYEVIHTIFGEILKVNYLVDPRVSGRITFRSVKPIKRADLLSVVSTLFRLNGVSIVEEAGIYRIIPLTEVSKEPVEIGFGRSPEDLEVRGRSIIQIIPLNFISSSEMKTILQPFLTKGATITEVPGRNLLIIADTDENMKRLLQIVETFDDEVFEDIKVEMFVFKNFNVRDVMDGLRGALPLFPTDEKGALKVRLLPIEKLNALLVVAPNQEYLDHVRKWVNLIDKTFEGASPKIYVYPLQNSKAEHVAEILQQILFGGGGISRSKAPSKTTTRSKARSTPTRVPAKRSLSISPLEEPLVSRGTKIFPDEITNSLIILTTPSDYPLIEDAIKKIDIVPRQVLIEVLVAEVTLSDKLKFGIEWFLKSHFSVDNTELTGFTAAGSDQLSFDIENPLSSSGFTFAAVDSADVIRGLLQSLASESKVKVLASPHIMVSDNREAKIQVGKQVPVQTSTSVTSGGETVTSIQYRDTGVVLTVKPQINEGGLVSLEVKQEVSSVDPEAGVSGNPIISNRMAETNIVVQDGQTVVIGGLIQENKSIVREGIPLLKDIPILGLLFGYTSQEEERTELVVMITPHVARSIDESRIVTEEFKKKLKGLKDTLRRGVN
jgi:general secretion pathway protein D